MTGLLIEGKTVGNGTFAVIYVDDVDNISSMTAIDGCNIDEIVAGSFAYDCAGKIAIYDSFGAWNIVGDE